MKIPADPWNIPQVPQNTKYAERFPCINRWVCSRAMLEISYGGVVDLKDFWLARGLRCVGQFLIPGFPFHPMLSSLFFFQNQNRSSVTKDEAASGS